MLARHLGVIPVVSTEVPKKATNSVEDEYKIVDAPTECRKGEKQLRKQIVVRSFLG